MKLIEMKNIDYLNLLKSDAPAPGGGTVSALAAAQGVALFVMVASLTVGKEKFAEYESICKEAIERGEVLYSKLTENIDKDTDAFNIIANAFKMPKSTDEEKKLRSQEIQRGTIEATKVPFSTLTLAYDALEIAETLVGKSNPNAASDLGVAISSLRNAMEGAWLNVKINLSGLKDEDLRKEFEEKGRELLNKGRDKSEELFYMVEKEI